jgi:hypothetical protein
VLVELEVRAVQEQVVETERRDRGRRRRRTRPGSPGRSSSPWSATGSPRRRGPPIGRPRCRDPMGRALRPRRRALRGLPCASRRSRRVASRTSRRCRAASGGRALSGNRSQRDGRLPAIAESDR